MSNFNRKGYTTIPYRDYQGHIRHMPVKIGSKRHRQFLQRQKRYDNALTRTKRQYKDELKAAKRLAPIEDRSKVPLSDVLELARQEAA